jgi:Fe-S oxidoreductase
VILDLRDHIRANAAPLLEARAASDAGEADRCARILGAMPVLAGGVIAPETLWACTTCRACEESCPVSIEHVPLIVGLRQNLAMEQAEVPDGVADLVGALEAREQPYRGAVADREGWYEGLAVRTLAEVTEPADLDLVYWVGCAATTDERVREVARATVRIMDHAGVRFAVLGSEERCSGDPARRTGNEYHYEMLARANVETLDRYGVRRIVTHCPHCLQSLLHEYPAFGGTYEVLHHTELVASLIEEGRIDLGTSERGSATATPTVTFHDPCYLGRYNRIFEPPREVLDDLDLVRAEMPRSGEGSFCCGAGGGHAFFDDGDGGKINRNRMREAAATGADIVCTACPFCLGMLEDAARAERPGGGAPRVRDLAELVADRLDGERSAEAARERDGADGPRLRRPPG